MPNLAGEFFPLPRGICFLICSVSRPLHLSCHFPSMLHAICSILELEPFILRVICLLELNLPCCMLLPAFRRWNFLFCMLFAAFGRRNLLLFIMLFAAFARRNLSVCVLLVEFGSWNLLCCCICCCYVCCCYVCCCAVLWFFQGHHDLVTQSNVPGWKIPGVNVGFKICCKLLSSRDPRPETLFRQSF